AMSSSKNSANPFLEAIWSKDPVAVGKLVASGTDLECKDRDGRTPLTNAVAAGDPGITRLLLEHGATADTKDKQGWTPLHFAAQNNLEEIAVLLIRYGAVVDAQDMQGNTPLWKAVFNCRGQGILIKLLRDHGADPRVSNNHGVSPLSLAKTISNYPVAQ